jgi:2-oxoglutarate ferredoxin oxidoreductase subunit alpha
MSRYTNILVPELNDGQLVRILRDRYLLPIKAYNKVKGMPFGPAELLDQFEKTLGLSPANQPA